MIINHVHKINSPENILNEFYQKIIKNLDKNRVFYNHYKETKTYTDLKKNIKKFNCFFNFKKKKNFCLFRKKL